MCEIWAAITPREPMTPEQLLRRKERQPERLYLIAEEDGLAVGLALVAPSDSPGRTFIGVRVLPEWRRRGIGSALYERHWPMRAASSRSGSRRWSRSRAAGSGLGRAARLRAVSAAGRALVAASRRRAAAGSAAGVEIVEVTPELHEAAYALSREAWEDLPLDIPVELSPFEVWLEEDLPRPDRFRGNGER